MLKCEYCSGTYLGDLSDAYAAGWGHLRFQFNRNGRIINFCPAHKQQAFNEILAVTQKVFSENTYGGRSHQQPNPQP